MCGESNAANAIASLLRASEEALLDPLVRKDRQRVSALLTEDFVEFGSSGKVWTREQILNLLAAEGYAPPTMEDFQCRQIANGVALVTYKKSRTDPVAGSRSA